MKLVMGTAQFGIKNYGINNSNLTILEIEEIMKFSKINNLTLFDTSDLYGDSLKIIDRYNSFGFSQIFKINDIEKLEQDFKKIKTPIHSILIHDISKIDLQLFKNFIFKSKIKYYGISIYTFQEFEEFIKSDLIPNIIEIPFSIIDIEFVKYFKKLKELKIKIIVRSIFMQGLLFKQKVDIPEKLYPFREAINKIEKITKKHKVSKSLVMFNFIKAYSEFIDFVVIGINSIDELKQNYNEFSKPFNYSIFNECININKSIMPYYKKINNWKYL